MNVKRFIALILALVACTGSLNVGATWSDPVNSNANVRLPTGMVTPFWVNVRKVTCALDISGKTAWCEAFISGLTGTTKITGTLSIYRKAGSSWVLLESWSGTANSSVLSFSETKAVSRGNTYKLIFSASAYRNGTWENITTESTIEVCN